MDICKIIQKFLLHTGICYIEVPGSTDLGIEVLLKKKNYLITFECECTYHAKHAAAGSFYLYFLIQ